MMGIYWCMGLRQGEVQILGISEVVMCGTLGPAAGHPWSLALLFPGSALGSAPGLLVLW